MSDKKMTFDSTADALEMLMNSSNINGKAFCLLNVLRQTSRPLTRRDGAETQCPTCGCDCTIGGDDKEGTHYYIPQLTRRDELDAAREIRNEFIKKYKFSAVSFDQYLNEQMKEGR